MDIRQTEFFLALVSERNFTRAAEITHVTQSGLSAAIRNLERELGAQLFDRRPRAVELTAAGHAFLPRARRILTDAHAALRELRQDGAWSAGVLAVAVEHCLGDLVELPELLSNFISDHPSLEIRFEQLERRNILDRLERRELDVALLAEVGGPPAFTMGHEIATTELAHDSFELVASPDHILAGRAQLDWSELEEHVFVDLAPGWSARRIVDDFLHRRGVARRSSFVVNDVHMLLDLVRRGLGVALIPASFARKPQATGLSRMRVHEPDLSWTVHLVDASPDDSASRLFARAVVSAMNPVQFRSPPRRHSPRQPLRAAG